jgi:hypothetical protein
MLSLVLIMIIVGNVILWSYQMNQLDWEKMQERIDIVSTQSENENWTQNPTAYALGGSTSWVSGGILDLGVDDDVYMTFRSYYSGTVASYFVDNDLSDVDSSPDKGTQSNFTAQKYGPDSIYDALTEENTAIMSNITLINAESFEGTWPPLGWIENSFWNRESDQAYDGTYSADFDGGFGRSGDLTTLDLDTSNATAIYVDFWYRDDGCESNEFVLQYYDGASWDIVADLGETSLEDQWLHYQETVTDGQYFKSDFKVQWSANTNFNDDDSYVDLVTVTKETGQTNYEFDLEVQWTNVSYDEANELLCIYGGTMSGENITVDVWTGSTWVNLFSDLSSGWNNVSVASHLDSSIFTIRFKGVTETSDSIQDSWNIDVALLRVWTDEYTSDVEFTGLSNVEEWTQLEWTTNIGWTIGSVDVTLQLYNFTLDGYSTSGDGYVAYASDSSPNVDENRSQIINNNPTDFRNATGYWRIKIKGTKKGVTQFDLKVDLIEFRETKLGTLVTFENGGSLTSHLVSLWVNNSTSHQRYEINLFIEAGGTESYFCKNVILSDGSYTLRVSTERGNVDVFSEG